MSSVFPFISDLNPIRSICFFQARFQIENSGVECHSDSDMIANSSCVMIKKGTREAISVFVNFKDGVEIANLYVIFRTIFVFDLVLLFFSDVDFFSGLNGMAYSWNFRGCTKQQTIWNTNPFWACQILRLICATICWTAIQCFWICF